MSLVAILYTTVNYTLNRFRSRSACLRRALGPAAIQRRTDERERKFSEAPVPVTRTKLVYLVPILHRSCAWRSATQARWMNGVSAWRRQTHKSETHRNNIPISFWLEIIMLCQCSFDSRCNLYRYYIIFCFFLLVSCFGFFSVSNITDPLQFNRIPLIGRNAFLRG